jgi:hypothetical protein
MAHEFNPFFHTISIHKCEGPSPTFVGSGVLLRIEGKDYVATASHVVDELPLEVGIGLVKQTEVLGCMDRPNKIFAKKQQDGTYKAGLDLAFLSVTDNYRKFIEQEGMSFFDLDKNASPPIIGECFISGFPAKKTYYDPRKRAYANTCGCYHIQSFVKNPESVLGIGGDPEFHFALEIRKRGDFLDGLTNKPIPELFDLHGMSGGAVWHMTCGQGGRIPNCATGIAGIIVEDRDTKKDRQGLAKVVKIEALRNLIKFAKSQPETLFFVQ